ncbi:hypothetical protein [Mycetohabitans rhizoxinica]|uniref:hypothetical protein n=1 Tax=Mycetohabitans rhizoxinica TaxID=412963 RepID=UPI0030D3D324
MSVWRRASIVLLLVLGLPIRLAVASVNCDLSQFTPPVAHAQSAHVKSAVRSTDSHEVLAARAISPDASCVAAYDGTHTDHRGHCDHASHHGAGQCSGGANCCVSAPLPCVGAIADIHAFVHLHLLPQPSVGAIRFLTGGIDRPPSAYPV